jgi:hypothetical protein
MTGSRNKFKYNLSMKYKNKFRHGYMEARKMDSDVRTALSPENIHIFVKKLCFYHSCKHKNLEYMKYRCL